jgi:hypothetical protein
MKRETWMVNSTPRLSLRRNARAKTVAPKAERFLATTGGQQTFGFLCKYGLAHKLWRWLLEPQHGRDGVNIALHGVSFAVLCVYVGELDLLVVQILLHGTNRIRANVYVGGVSPAFEFYQLWHRAFSLRSAWPR